MLLSFKEKIKMYKKYILHIKRHHRNYNTNKIHIIHFTSNKSKPTQTPTVINFITDKY